MTDKKELVKNTKKKVAANTSPQTTVSRENYKMRLAAYLLTIGARTKDIATALDCSTQWVRTHYRDNPRVMKYREEYEKKLATEIEADFGRIVKELKSIAYAKVRNIKPSDKLGALRQLSDLSGKNPPKKLEITGEGGGPVGLAAYRQLSAEELKEKISERTKALESAG